MHKAFAGLTRRQLIILAFLFVGDVAVLLMGFLIATGQPPPVDAAVPAMSQASCQAMGAERLAAHNLAGVAQLDADGALHFELSGRDISGNTLQRVTEAAWDALGAAASLSEEGCGPYPAVRVDVPDSVGQPGAHLQVEVNWIDLRAWGEHELDDGELAARSSMTTYVQPELTQP